MLRKLFNLYPGEGRNATLFLILGFFWSFGAFGGLTLSEGMFLEHVGAAQLPLSYLITACAMCALSTLLLFALNHLSIKRLLFTVLCTASCSTLFLFLFLTFGFESSIPLWFWYLFKAIGWMTPIAIYICFWAFIDQYYDLQDAKRCFCLFNSVLYLGDAFAGALISFFFQSLGAGGILLTFVGGTLATLPFIYFISRKMRPVSEESQDGNSPQRGPLLSTICRLIVKSPFTLILMLFYFLMQLIVITTEYSYMDAFDHTFATLGKSHHLIEFLGMLAMCVSLGNLFFGLFFYSRTVTRFGVNNMILIAPLFFLLLFSFWVSKEVFICAIFAFIAREGLVYTFDDNNLLLLISGVPTKIKNQVRIAIESFFEPIGMLVGATILLFFQKESHELGLILCVGAVTVVLFLRSHYPKAIFRNVMAHAIHFEKKVSDWIESFSKKEKKKMEASCLASLQNGDEKTKLLAYEYLLKTENIQFLPSLLNQFEILSVQSKLKILELLSESIHAKDPRVIEKLSLWRTCIPLPLIRSAIHLYLAKHQLMKKEMVMDDLESEHLTLQAAAILSLKTSSETLTQSLQALEKLNRLLQSSLPEEICLGLLILGLEKRKENIRSIFPYLFGHSLSVIREAAKALALCADTGSEYTHDLIHYLSKATDSEVRLQCFIALEKMCDETSAVTFIKSTTRYRTSERKFIETICQRAKSEDLLALVRDENLSICSRLLAGKILGKFFPLQLRESQKELMRREIERAYFYLYHAEMIKHEEKDHDLAILKNALQTSFKSILDFIIQLGVLSGSLEESEILSRSLLSKNRKVRAHALETLEKTIEPALYALIKPLMDERRLNERLSLYVKKGIKPVTLTELLETLQKSPSVANQIVSLTLQARLKLPNWKEALKERLKNGDEIFQHFAHEL